MTPWTVALQAPLPMGFSRQEYWNRLPFPSPGDLPDPGVEPASPASLALHVSFFTTKPWGKTPVCGRMDPESDRTGLLMKWGLGRHTCTQGDATCEHNHKDRSDASRYKSKNAKNGQQITRS